MDSMKMTKKFIALMAVLAGLALAGCGGDGSGAGPLPGRNMANPPEPSSGLHAKDLSDTTTRAIELKIAPELNDITGETDVYLRVFDQNGIELMALNKYNFGLVINDGSADEYHKMAIPSVSFSRVVDSDEHIVAMAIDSSGSMDSEDPPSKMDEAKVAATSFVDLMADTDKTAIIDFDDRVKLVQGLTSFKSFLHKAIDDMIADGTTSAFPAVVRAVSTIGVRPGKRAVILLTDGEDNSDMDVEEAIAAAQDEGIPVFTIGFAIDGPDLVNPDGSEAYQELNQIAMETQTPPGAVTLAADAAALNTALGATIPASIAALEPADAWNLKVPNLAPSGYGIDITVQVNAVVVYENALGLHVARASGTYISR